MVMSHGGLKKKAALVLGLLDVVVMPAPSSFRDLLRRLADLGIKGTVELEARARDLLVRVPVCVWGGHTRVA